MSFSDHHLQETLSRLVEEGRLAFVLNLAGVTYLDSYGLQDLATAYNAMKTAGGKLVLLKPIPNVRKTIEITMKDLFKFFEDQAAATQSVR